MPRLHDLADAQQVQNVAEDLLPLGIDVLINNAPLGHWNYMWDTTADTMRSMIAVNVSAVAALTEGLSRELTSDNLPMRAQLLAPGPIAIEFTANSLEGSKKAFATGDMERIQIHTADEVAELAMQFFDSDAMVGAGQPDMSFVLSGGLHAVGQLSG